MTVRFLLSILLSLFVLSIALYAAYSALYIPRETPKDYMEIALSKSALPGHSCSLRRPFKFWEEYNSYDNIIETGGGGDTLVTQGGRYIIEYDSASGQTLEDHDRVVVMNAAPEYFTFIKEGPHLVLCSQAYHLNIVLLRHYCHSTTASGTSWNNTIEEIAFPASGVTLLAEPLFDEWERGTPYPSETTLRKYGIKDIDQYDYARATSHWQVIPLSQEIPNGLLSEWQCDLDLIPGKGKPKFQKLKPASPAPASSSMN